MLLFTKCNLHKLDQMHCSLQSVQKLPSIHFQYSRGPHCGALLPTVRAESSTLDTHVTLWLGNGNVDMQLCVYDTVTLCVSKQDHWFSVWPNVRWFGVQCSLVARCTAVCRPGSVHTHTGAHAVRLAAGQLVAASRGERTSP